MYKALLRYVLPSEIVSFFDLVNLQKREEILHLYFEESHIVPEEYKFKFIFQWILCNRQYLFIGCLQTK